jgi:hypothetical protein
VGLHSLPRERPAFASRSQMLSFDCHNGTIEGGTPHGTIHR